MMLTLYRGAATLAAPVIRALLVHRRHLGKEDAARFAERTGIPSLARPDGALVWLHAASVGESISALSLIERLAEDYPHLALLVTTGTVTSAGIMARRLPPGAMHQYAPVDMPRWVGRFLDHWRPSLALWMESEFWPTAVTELHRRSVPIVLVNARISDRSFRGWRRAPGTIARLLAPFSLCLAQSNVDRDRLLALGARTVRMPGNLKFAAAPLPAADRPLEVLQRAIAGRPVWVAFSTHEGEEDAVADAHRVVAGQVPDVLTVIAPRHPARGPGIAGALAARGLRVARRGAGEPALSDTEVYVADTVGELGLFFRLAHIAFVGGSLVPHGGQNPLEAAKLDCAIVHGPHMGNFAAIVEEMQANQATVAVDAPAALGPAVAGLFADTVRRDALAAAAFRLAAAKTEILDAVMAELAPLLDAIDGPAGREPAEHARSRA